MRGTCTLFAVALAEMMTVGVASTGGVTEESTVDLGEEEHEGLLSVEELDEMYDELDTDKDGKLVESEVWNSILEELDASPDAWERTDDKVVRKIRVKQLLKASDADKDGTISKPELASFLESVQDIHGALEELDRGASSTGEMDMFEMAAPDRDADHSEHVD